MQLHWIVFAAIIISLILFDLGIFNKKNEEISFKKSVILSLIYFLAACLFGVYVYNSFGYVDASEYFTGFLIEKTLSLDNIFVISTIFRVFDVPSIYRHRVLFWGILGVVIFRAILIALGSALLSQFEWVIYLFGAILAATGIKLIIAADKQIDIKRTFAYLWIVKNLRVTKNYKGDKFLHIQNGKLYFTPLFVSLLLIEFMDLVFALDSIPAIFAITDNLFIVYTSNIFAIIGLRALFFLLENMTKRFVYLKYALAILLILISIKIFISHYIKIDIVWTLSITAGIIAASMILSILREHKKG